MDSEKKTLIIIAVVGTIVTLVLAFLIYYFIIRDPNAGRYQSRLSSSKTDLIKHDFIKQPTIDNGMTFHFGLKVDNFYLNHLRWKHLFHKGTFRSQVFDYKYWYNIEAEIPKQAIGCWIHPDKNALRIAVSTLITTNHDITDHPDIDKMPLNLPQNSHIESIEYCDVPDVPPNELVFYTIVVEGQTISVFKNKKLIKTCGLRGKVILNNGDLYFHKQKTYSGHMLNFQYLNKALTGKQIMKKFNINP